MLKIDVVCLLYRADVYIDKLLANLAAQEGVEIVNGVFPLTEDGSDTSAVRDKVLAAGYTCYPVQKKDFSHSTTREDAIFHHCTSDIVVMLSQDVTPESRTSLYDLASAVTDGVPYVYGRQVTHRRHIEYYIRRKNYGETSFTVGSDDVERLQLQAFCASDAFSAYDRAVFVKLDGYDGQPMMMNEDMYYAKKVIDAGYRKGYVATAVVEHAHYYTFRQLYHRYYETGLWFAEHPEFDDYKTTDSGMALAAYVLKQALKHCNLLILFRFLPDMAARYLGMRKGKKQGLRTRDKQPATGCDAR